ncbi:hypothetical protein NTGHW29_100038 [Candidatus Nitrotoga sp. HW29]|nr:hypothetical protein NTGHW29_100038 [Candidatus Nitrotoga sp. HW29]
MQIEVLHIIQKQRLNTQHVSQSIEIGLVTIMFINISVHASIIGGNSLALAQVAR